MVSLVTGGTGFIGSRLTNTLKNREEVRLVSRNPGDNNVVCDLLCENFPDGLFLDVETVFHMASYTHDVGNEQKSRELYEKLNIDATIRLAEFAAASGVKKFIFVSSVKAGGRPIVGLCASESDQFEPEGLYGETKRKAELKVLKIGKNSGMHVSIIRPSLVYGPNAKGNLQLMLSGIEKGWFPPLPETGNRRSMIHVDDLVRAILLISEDKRANGEIFIATDGAPYSSREIYNAMCDVMGKSTPKWSMPKILFDIASLLNPRIKYKLDKLLGDECYSSAKLEALGFTAKKSLKDMNETDF